ncbi:hypothetical protein M1L60_21520 [Actinoplanes sp. TRM 88003]|uniref:Uncharacterized protein n=2 Tax=Paractinoplanes aksuensis TaxID=2939490 RepID=A0ABT1DU00_9ACTN|nr:hypothetical protein [Actinoplanes aksuensis]
MGDYDMTEDGRQRDDTISATTRPVSFRKRKLAVGAVGLATVLGTGAFLVADRAGDENIPAEGRVALTPEAAESRFGGTEPDVKRASPTEETPSSSPKASPATVMPSVPAEVRKKIEDARRKMAEDGVPVQGAVEQQMTSAGQRLAVTTQETRTKGGTLTVTAARGDLTGQGRLANVSGGVGRHRGVPCSQTFQFSAQAVPAKKDNLLMCWRVTANKSVVAMVVDLDGKPSRDKAVDAIDKKWSEMG